MTHHKLPILILIAALLLCASPARAQENTSTAVKKKVDNDAAVRDKAFELLESLATQLGTLQSAENRARIGSNIAATLWAHDEKRARALFIAVEEDIKLGFQQAPDDVDQDHTVLVFLQLRSDTIERIAKYDPELAFDFLASTKPSFADPPSEIIERERALELRLAKQITATNPDLALKLGRQSLAQGFSDNLLELLRNLHRKHREQGVMLYKESVRKLKKTNLMDDEKARQFALALAFYPTPPLADDVAFRELINTLITRALESNCDKSGNWNLEEVRVCGEFGSVVDQLAKVDPVRAARLYHSAASYEMHEWSLPLEIAFTLDEILENGTLDQLPALTQKYPDYRIQIYIHATMKSYGAGDIERAKKIATEYIDDPELKQSLLERIQRNDSLSSISDEELANVQKVLGEIHRSGERVDYLMSEVNRIGGRNHTVALKLLEQAYGLIDSIKPAGEQTGVRLRLAMLFCAEKNDRGLAMMESLMPKLNELVDAAAKLDGLETDYLRDGEWNMSAEGDLGDLLTFLAENATYFAWCDFDRAVSLAAQFERAEIRMMAQLKLAQGIVAGRPKGYPTRPDLYY